jgi:hypothetical protein
VAVQRLTPAFAAGLKRRVKPVRQHALVRFIHDNLRRAFLLLAASARDQRSP